METLLKSIGIIHTPITKIDQAPIQSIRSQIEGTIEIYPEYSEGLEGIEEFSHIYLLYVFHLSQPNPSLKVKPFLDDQLHGVFATRYPSRPNPLGISVVNLVFRHDNILGFIGADMLDETPLLDVKPYIPEFDVFRTPKTGWFKSRKHK